MWGFIGAYDVKCQNLIMYGLQPEMGMKIQGGWKSRSWGMEINKNFYKKLEKLNDYKNGTKWGWGDVKAS